MNKKTISVIGIILLVFVLIGVLVAKLYEIGVNRPSLVYKTIEQPVSMWVNTLGTLTEDMSFSASQFGPFDWNNNQDIGQKNELGKWAKEEDANTVVYYRKDKDAIAQVRARNILDEVMQISYEIPDLMGAYISIDSVNGRKLAIYIPNTDEEYQLLANKLSKDKLQNGNGFGCSIMQLGPLGCQMKGILLHPNGFKDLEYHKVLRREVARYVFFSRVNYAANVHHYRWFTDGLVEFFATEADPPADLPENKIAVIEKSCKLDAEFPAKDHVSQWAGASFFRFYDEKYGDTALAGLVQNSYQMHTDSVFCTMHQDISNLRQGWIEYLKSKCIEKLN